MPSSSSSSPPLTLQYHHHYPLTTTTHDHPVSLFNIHQLHIPRPKANQQQQDDQEEEEGQEEEEEEEEEEVKPKRKQQDTSEYEKQRLSRIAENRARMEALGLSKMASSLMGSSRNSSKLKGKRKVVEDDEDYRPNDEEDHDDDDNDDKLDDDYDDEEDFRSKKTPQSRKNKVKNKGSKPKRKAPVLKHLSSSDCVDDDDELMKAIALSLQDSGEVSGAVQADVQDATFIERKGNARLKKKKSFTSRVQMTEDEMVVHFFQFDEAGKGGISMRDLRRVAIAHDFIWTDKELSDMIHCFDVDRDGKLNLDDFRKIVSRCNMLQTSDNS